MRETFEDIERTLSEVKASVYEYIQAKPEFNQLGPAHLHDAVSHALGYGGKCLRPAALLLACEAAGGDRKAAVPAAAGVEIYHTWTLVHDDVIDRDRTRRGHETIHEEFRHRAMLELGCDEPEARHYGISVAILVGDVLQGWATSAFCDLMKTPNVNPALALHLIQQLTTHVQNSLVEGETLDVQFSKFPLEQLQEGDIIEMLRKKTAVLFEFAVKAGAMIGRNTVDTEDKVVHAMSRFGENCGIAFQIQDDVLGVIGSEETLGKPVGSDLREGKKTVIIHHALSKANNVERALLLDVLGNQTASPYSIIRATNVLIKLDSVDRARELAQKYKDTAIACLNETPDSPQKQRLLDWAEYLIAREA